MIRRPPRSTRLVTLFPYTTLFRSTAAPLSSDETRALARIGLANYVAGALVLPYRPFLDAAQALRYDIELLQQRFHVGYETVAHRLSTLQRPGAKGVPFFFIRVDRAGNISKRQSATSFHFSRVGGSCPLWNVYEAFARPGHILTQLTQMPDGRSYLWIARTVTRRGGGYGTPAKTFAIGLGCDLRHARGLVYSDGLDLASPSALVPIGPGCKVCDRDACPQRAFPAIGKPLDVSPHHSRFVPYATSDPPASPRPVLAKNDDQEGQGGDDDSRDREPIPGGGRRHGLRAGRGRLGLLRAIGERRDHDIDVKPERHRRRGIIGRRGAERPEADPAAAPRPPLRPHFLGDLPAARGVRRPGVDRPSPARNTVPSRPLATDAQQIGRVEPRHGRPARPVLADRVDDSQAVSVRDDPGPLRGRVHDPRDQQQGARGDHRQMITALHGQVDQVADREEHPEPPDRDRDRRAEHLPITHAATLVVVPPAITACHRRAGRTCPPRTP